MSEKINSKKKLLFHCFIVSLFLVLVYSRFVGLNWGLPYPMHPDERNMANAVQSLNCNIKYQISNIKECFNPHFFAYGQFPLYLGYLIVYFLKFFDGDMGFPIGLQEATASLRIISAIASIINVIIIIKIINIIAKKKSFLKSLISCLVLIFSPYAIQFSHFGTTESLLMLFYSLIVYFSIRLLERRTTSEVVCLALVSGLAVATKVSSTIFLVVPIIALISNIKNQKLKLRIKIQKFLILNFYFVFCALMFAILFSPHNFINFQDFVSSIRYESEVALGKSLVFYTRQFFNTQPFYFQLTKIFPYALGWPVFILGGLGFLGLNWKDRKMNLLRFALLVYFIPTAMIYAKWSRFMAPIFPVISIFAILFMKNIFIRLNRKFWIPAFAGMTLLLTIPGIAYLRVYQNPDVRFQASDWIYENISNNSYVLSETANVVDIPMSNGTMEQSNNYSVISFNFYDLDQSPELQSELKNHLEKADYIFVPSRRIFANHPKQRYPILNKYYDDLFSGKLGFEKVAEFSSGLNDEAAEETWTVFDHPVIRIYKRLNLKRLNVK